MELVNYILGILDDISYSMIIVQCTVVRLILSHHTWLYLKGCPICNGNFACTSILPLDTVRNQFITVTDTKMQYLATNVRPNLGFHLPWDDCTALDQV
jgi:hypothetical protein